jgi:hypothetical protein
MEHAYWLYEREGESTPLPEGRVYFGHETCEHRLPLPEDAAKLATRLRDHGIPATLVTPFLSEKGLNAARRLVDRLRTVLEDLEVVCSDWGLLDWLCGQRPATPVVGRLLSLQVTDPRLGRLFLPSRTNSRLVTHLDGTVCELAFRSPSAVLARHYSGCWVDKPEVIAFFTSQGVRRCEISNPLQGVALSELPGWSYSLHVSDVLVAVMRHCPGPGEDLNRPAACPCQSGEEKTVPWQCAGLPVSLFRRANALYYAWPTLQANFNSLPINRLVHRATSAMERSSDGSL